MKHVSNAPLVTTIRERCRVCYACVRECPAKAIRIADGQADVIPERCIGCGNCVRVCSQKAKQVLEGIPQVETLLASGRRVAACLAPSFPAEFAELDYSRLVGGVRSMGFDLVCEVAFGADLVAAEYRKLLAAGNGRAWIETTCPAVVGYVERYHPELIPSLAPIVSPMIAMARALHRIHGSELGVVFIGPCIAKKGEAASQRVLGDVDAVLTFVELRELFRRHSISPELADPSEFDPPHPGLGGLFPIGRGMLQAAGLQEDLVAGEIVSAEGRVDFVEGLHELAKGDLRARLLQTLCCKGCIGGAGMSDADAHFLRRESVSRHVRERAPLEGGPRAAEFADLGLGRQFGSHDARIPPPTEEHLQQILRDMEKRRPEDELNCGACGYDTCREHAGAIHQGLAEGRMCLPYLIGELQRALQQLAGAQEALIQSEKLASMGQLAAGIAHEVNNPLGIVLMYAHLLLEEGGVPEQASGDLKLIVEQADRCRRIVAGLLDFARQNKVSRSRTDLGSLAERAADLVAVREPARFGVHQPEGPVIADVDADQFIQVLVNLYTNAMAAMPTGGRIDVTLGRRGDSAVVQVADTGTGIPEEYRRKIFEPFFTTKDRGQGTGLGLAVVYGIVKMHSGDIRVESNDDAGRGPTGSVFTITLPLRAPAGNAREPAAPSAPSPEKTSP